MALALLLWQGRDFAVGGPAAWVHAEPQHMRYERSIVLPAGASGMACAVLDATALAHAASRSGDDLRVFDQRGGMAVETPFALTESEAAPGEPEPAAVKNASLRDGAIVFDLMMPQRAYTTVELEIAAKDFVGTAKVWGVRTPGGVKGGRSSVALGSFAVFDLSGQHLAGSTALPLEESMFPVLHVELRLRGVGGRALRGLSAAMVKGAEVPPSREAQTLYTTVAATNAIGQEGAWTMAKFHVPAHVPIERVSFVLDPKFGDDFLRGVLVRAKTDGRDGSDVEESIGGEISRVSSPGAADMSGEPPIKEEKLSVDAVLASNLRAPATIRVAVNNAKETPLPLREVKLEMRRRMICFNAVAGGSYALRYGDAALGAPVYDFARMFEPVTKPVMAQLEPEVLNPQYAAPNDERPYTERHPELLWIGLLLAVTAMGTVASHHVKRKGRHR